MPVQTTPVPAYPGLQDWGKLINLRPPAILQTAVNLRFSIFQTKRMVHAIEDAQGPINLDFYPVRVEAMPLAGDVTMQAPALLEYIRRNINDFVDGSPNGCNFTPYDPLIDTAVWTPPSLQTGLPGAVLSIDMFSSYVNVDDGSVVLSEITPDYWIFSTLWTPNDGGHPVSGNRMFGFAIRSAGEFVFFTRGADRTTSFLDDLVAETVFGSAHSLWLSFQRRVAAFINGNGGMAHIEPAISNRYDWPTVSSSYHSPTVPWVI